MKRTTQLLLASLFLLCASFTHAQEKQDHWSIYSNSMLGLGEVANSFSAVYENRAFFDLDFAYGLGFQSSSENGFTLWQNPRLTASTGLFLMKAKRNYSGLFVSAKYDLLNLYKSSELAWFRGRNSHLITTIGYRNFIKQSNFFYHVELGAEYGRPSSLSTNVAPYINLRIGYNLKLFSK